MAHILDKSYFIVLGASSDQKESILVANELGFRTLVFDKNKSSYCKKYAYKFFNVSTVNFSLIKKKIDKYKKKIAGVITQGSDIPFTVSKIEKYLKIYGRTPLNSALVCSNKLLMKNFFTQNKIPTAKQFKNIHQIKKSDYPVVVKPIDMSGSKGVYFCRNFDEINFFSKISKKKSKKKKIIIEKFLHGPQLSTESLIIKKNVYTFGYAERNYKDTKEFYPNILENGGTQIAKKYFSYKKKVDFYIKKIAKKLKIDNGVIKSDLVINNNRISFIEIATRLSGGDFSATLIPKSTGVNFIKCAVKNAAGLKVFKNELISLKNVNKKYYANRYFFSVNKKNIKKIYVPKFLKNVKWIHKLEFNTNILIKKTQSHKDRYGVFIVSAKNLNQLTKRINFVYNNIKILYE